MCVRVDIRMPGTLCAQVLRSFLMQARSSLGFVDADEEGVADRSVRVSCWLSSVCGCYMCGSVGACAAGYTTWMYAVTGGEKGVRGVVARW